MTPKQKDALTHIHLFGCDGLSNISGRVLYNCCRKGWIEIDPDSDFPYGLTASETDWILTDSGRRALADA